MHEPERYVNLTDTYSLLFSQGLEHEHRVLALVSLYALSHLLRGIDRCLNLSELHEHLADFYSHTGRPSIDPELMIRMLIVGYCYGTRCIAVARADSAGPPLWPISGLMPATTGRRLAEAAGWMQNEIEWLERAVESDPALANHCLFVGQSLFTLPCSILMPTNDYPKKSRR